ncbi:MAG: aldehyde dehydrogenase family protein [Acidobacteriota bacterium]
MLHIPILRGGRPHRSLQTHVLRDVRTGEPIAETSQAIPGLIARDLARDSVSRRLALEARPVAALIEACHRAADLFAEAELPLAPGSEQRLGPDQYLENLAATTGMPIAMGRANLGKIVHVLRHIEDVLDGLTRGLDLGVLDGGWGTMAGRRLSYQRLTDALGAVLPNNSPGVHNLWIPAIPLKTPLVLKPGSSEPWTPYRISMALIEAGVPGEAFSLYPTGYNGVPELLLRTGRSLFFGDASTVEAWRGTGKVQIHGPGWSKVLVGPDAAASWRDHLELFAGSVAKNGGRSCINCSSIWVPAEAGVGRELAEALAAELAKLEPRPLDDPQAQLAAFPDPAVARAVSEAIDQEVAGEEPDDRVDDLSAHHHAERVVDVGGCTFLRPTVVHVTDPAHALAHTEYGFPFVAVVECPESELFDAIGPTLIGSVLSDDASFRNRALACRSIDRLNLGPMPTYKISWDQPHEGNLFDHLYHQRAFQLAS